MLVDVDVLTDHIVYHALYLTQLLVGNLLEVREVEAQGVGAYERTLLLYVVAQNLLQCIVEQVGSCMVSGRGITFVGIHTSHELGCRILWQGLYDVYALTVLALGIDNVDGLGLIAEYTTVTYLTTHLTIEWGIVENQLIELVLLLGYLAVTHNMALVFCMVVANELLFALS